MIEHNLQQSLLKNQQQALTDLLYITWSDMSEDFKAYTKLKRIPRQKVLKRIKHLNDLIKHLDVSLEELMVQF